MLSLHRTRCNRRKRERHRPILANGRDPVHAQAQRGYVTILCQFDRLPRQSVRFAIKQRINRERRLVAGAGRPPLGIAALTLLKAVSLLLRCIIRTFTYHFSIRFESLQRGATDRGRRRVRRDRSGDNGR
jgi:hypothetical protein